MSTRLIRSRLAVFALLGLFAATSSGFTWFTINMEVNARNGNVAATAIDGVLTVALAWSGLDGAAKIRKCRAAQAELAARQASGAGDRSRRRDRDHRRALVRTARARRASTGMRALLFDLDGTLYTDAGAIPGAVDALRDLKRRGVPFRYVTNTTRRSRRLLAERLAGYGFEARAEDIISAPQACVAVLQQRGIRRVAAFVAEPTLEDFAAFDLTGPKPEAVVVGDLGDGWDFAKLNRAFLHLMDGAELIALQRDRYWLRGDGLALDAGPFVAALEYATGRAALVCGKPSKEFYGTALASLGREAVSRPKDVVMVGDDLWGDVEGAQRAGLTAWMVRTGKFREDVVAKSGIVPDRVIPGVAELPALL